MEIAVACQTIRQWGEVFDHNSNVMSSPPSLPAAHNVLRNFLEDQRGGKPIPELMIADEFLQTKHGVRWLMLFVLQAEAMLAKH